MLSKAKPAAALLPLGLMLTLAACGGAEETTYEVDATTEGPGELIVADEPAGSVPVDVPDAPVTVETEFDPAVEATTTPPAE